LALVNNVAEGGTTVSSARWHRMTAQFGVDQLNELFEVKVSCLIEQLEQAIDTGIRGWVESQRTWESCSGVSQIRNNMDVSGLLY
jgi:hypothetical protein